MKRLNTNAVTSDIGLVLQHKHLDFIQDKTEESLIHSIYSQLGGVNTSVVILYGCVPTFTTTTTTNDTLTITAGAISYQGKIYEVSARTQVKTGSAVHLLKIYAPSYDASDPSLFTDGVSRNVQEIRVAALSVGVSGSGISDWANVSFLNSIFRKVWPIGSWNMDTTSSINIPHGLLDISKIINYNVVILEDDGSGAQQLTVVPISGSVSGSISFDATNIYMTRQNGSIFDNANFNDTSVNRGWINIEYKI